MNTAMFFFAYACFSSMIAAKYHHKFVIEYEMYGFFYIVILFCLNLVSCKQLAIFKGHFTICMGQNIMVSHREAKQRQKLVDITLDWGVKQSHALKQVQSINQSVK
jgi:hypothetical protein